MSPKKAFGILAGIFGVAIGVGVIGGLTVPPTHLSTSARTIQPPAVTTQEDRRAREHRMQAAEQMINRLNQKLINLYNGCNQTTFRTLAEQCKTAAIGVAAQLTVIREVASSGDVARWAKVVNISHETEAIVESMLTDLKR